ncbi:MAG: hypothetical protein LBD80_07140 [Tannerella sp.]|jgi:hypothetical protein|nr:hypothetical protein [Tannerella sp.]
MNKGNPEILVVVPSRKTRGGITAIIKIHEKSFASGLPVNAGDAEDLAAKIRLVYECYLSGEIHTNYLLAGKTRLDVFDISVTAKRYLEQYNSKV